MSKNYSEKKSDTGRRLKAQFKHEEGGVSAPVIDIAKYLISKCTIDQKPLNAHNLQVLLYVLQREALEYMGMPIHHGVFHAWDSGPVVEEIYESFEKSGTVRNMYKDIGVIRGTSFIDLVLEEYLELPGMELHNASTKKTGAWQTIYSQHKGEKKEIPLYMIKVKG